MQTSLVAPYLGMECASGHDMLTQLQQDLGTLTPSLRRVAQYCIAHSHALHRMGIQEVAAASQTIPAAVVRLAQRYGLKGFRELKLAFLPTLPLSKAQAATLLPAPSAPQHTAMACIDKMAADIAQVRSDILRPEFSRAVDAIKSAERIFMTAPAGAGLVSFHQRLHQGLCQRLGVHRVLTCDPGEVPAVAGDLWILLPSAQAISTRGSRAYRQVASQPNALHVIEFRSTGFTVAGELIASFRAIHTRQDAFRTLAFCDALSSAIADEAPAQVLVQGTQLNPNLEGNLHVHLD